MVLCEFCNTPNNCKQCCSKKFPFAQESRPGQNSPDEEFVEDSIFGQICKICETKIYVKKYHEEVDQQVQKHKKNKIHKQQELKVLQAKQITLKSDSNQEIQLTQQLNHQHTDKMQTTKELIQEVKNQMESQKSKN